MLGLADCIVDIVDTGNTLRANGLEERELIARSHPVIVNRASMKTKFAEVQDLIAGLCGLLPREGRNRLTTSLN